MRKIGRRDRRQIQVGPAQVLSPRRFGIRWAGKLRELTDREAPGCKAYKNRTQDVECAYRSALGAHKLTGDGDATVEVGERNNSFVWLTRFSLLPVLVAPVLLPGLAFSDCADCVV